MTLTPTPSVASPHPGPAFRGALVAADRALVFFGMILLLGIVKYLISGNSEAEDLTGAGDPLARASWYPLYLALIFALAARLGALARLILPAWPMFALLVITVASFTWSVAPDVTARRIVAVIFTVLFGVYLALRTDRMDTLRVTGAAIITAALFNLAVVIVSPANGVDHLLHPGAWKGASTEKNGLGGDMSRAALIVMALAFLDQRRRWIWLAGLALVTLLVIGSQSRTALLALLAPSGLFVLYLIARRSAVMALAVIYVSVTAGAAILLFIFLAPEQAVGLIGKDLTFTGRTGIWELSIIKIMDAPWTGYGLGAFWVDIYGPSFDIRNQLQWVVPSAHNNWIEIGLGLGLPGIALLAVTVAMTLLRSGWSVLSGASPFAFLGVVQLLLFSLSESAIFWYQNTFSCTLFAFYVAATFLPEAKRKTPAAAPPPRPRLTPLSQV